jgi:methionyl-tRNA synthetase
MPIEQIRGAVGTNRYITTALPYVNAPPHVGFALEVVQADTLARFYRQQGHNVRLQAGTDENSLKNVQAADAAGVPVADLVQQNAGHFISLKQSLHLSYDDFIRTSANARHRRGVEQLWYACCAKGDIYKRAYSGLYCTGCEQFYRIGDLDEGRCPEHASRPELIEEENWFFRLSRYQDALRELYARRGIEVIPEPRRNEVLSWIDGGLEDFSISRSATRARGWGIPVPNDPAQVVYVWFDALASYLTALGYGSENDNLSKWWTHAAAREHVIGKGIIRFHAVYWPAMLLSAGLPVPTRILVHGYVTAEGRKIGKSTGNAVDPVPLANELGADALRYFLLRHIRSTGDGDFSHARFHQAYQSELAGQLGNLVHRVLSMIERYCGGITPAPPDGFVEADRLLRMGERLPETIAAFLPEYAFDRALEEIWTFVAAANRYVAEAAPWVLAKAAGSRDPEAAEASEASLRGSLFSLSAALLTIATCLAPLLPEASRKLFQKLGATDGPAGQALAGRRIEVGMPLFPRA